MTVDQLGRAYQAFRRTTDSRSMAALLVANAIPLVGVFFFRWSLLTILVLYWIENGIVGFWNLPRIMLAQGTAVPLLPPLPDAAARAATGTPEAGADPQAAWARARDSQLVASAKASGDIGAAPGFVRLFGSSRVPTAGRVGLALFFTIHYGIFWFVHGIFVFTLPAFLGGGLNRTLAGCGDEDLFGALQPCGSPFGDIVWSNIAIAAVALFLSHGASFLFNYIGNSEYLTASPTAQMGAPYGRVVVLHLTILFGAFAVAFLGSPVAALLLLVGLKTALDVGLHRREHAAAAARIPADTTFGQSVRGS
ncbi:MAG: hypothetical protein HYX55_00560 [Chloroflexi bacterium]|nr:hypothetical protein [Chloroflexota bacterium]